MEVNEILESVFNNVSSCFEVFVNEELTELKRLIWKFMKTHPNYLFAPVNFTYNTDTEEYIAVITYYYKSVK